MAEFYVYDPAANEYVGPIKEIPKVDITASDLKDADMSWSDLLELEMNICFPGLNRGSEWIMHLILGTWVNDISEHGGVI